MFSSFWEDGTCDYRSRMTRGCICGSPLNVSTAYLDDVARMEAPAEAHLDALGQTGSRVAQTSSNKAFAAYKVGHPLDGGARRK